MKLRLFHYWRSSASWRVRWALELKKVPFEAVPVNLLEGQQKSPEHLKRNPLGTVPVLEIDGQTFLSQSAAIVPWIEETFPTPSLFPNDPLEKAKIYELCEIINSGTHPIQNLSVQKYYSDDPEKKKAWARHWIENGLTAFEKLCEPKMGTFCVGDSITAADLFLIPQIYNGLRFGVDLEGRFPKLAEIYKRARDTEECKKSAPEAYDPNR